MYNAFIREEASTMSSVPHPTEDLFSRGSWWGRKSQLSRGERLLERLQDLASD